MKTKNEYKNSNGRASMSSDFKKYIRCLKCENFNSADMKCVKYKKMFNEIEDCDRTVG